MADAPADLPDRGTGMSRRRFLRTAGVVGGALAAGSVAATADAAPRPLVHGVAATTVREMLNFEAAASRFIRSFTFYRSWGATGVNLDWEANNIRWLVGRGTTPVITFQPQDPAGGLIQPAYSHAAIVAGAHDRLLLEWAQMLQTVGGPVVMRPMHEANGSWYPWCPGLNGNTASSYVDAWRHIHDVMVVTGGATNLRWLWSMNKVYEKGTPLVNLYPGDDVVDEVGFSGYNGGTDLERGGWRSPAEIFDASLYEAARICDKPRYVAETACVEKGGDKAAWIGDLWSWLAGNNVAGVTWFNVEKNGVNWRVDSTPAAQTAYRRGAIATIPPRF